jgi:hypothetical protein
MPNATVRANAPAMPENEPAAPSLVDEIGQCGTLH